MSMNLSPIRRTFLPLISLPLLLAAGCSSDGTVTVASPNNLAVGNWQISSSDTAAARLPAFSGAFTSEEGTITGTLHSQGKGACVDPTTAFKLSGSADSKSVVTLTAPLAGGTLMLTGALAADGKSLTDATYNVVGGSCALSEKVKAVAQVFSPMNGNYAGSFADVGGNVAQVTANFSQSTAPDSNGNFTLQGSASIVGDPCFASAIPVSSTQVTGNTFTYSLSSGGNNVTASGTFNADASVLTINRWSSSGSCGADTGVTSTMARQ